MPPVPINLNDHVTGDTWEGISIGPVLFNGAKPPYALASCRLYFRDANNKSFAYGFKSSASDGFGLISITSGDEWRANIPAQPLPLHAGRYSWDFETTDSSGIVRTIYAGVLKVLEDSSHD